MYITSNNEIWCKKSYVMTQNEWLYTRISPQFKCAFGQATRPRHNYLSANPRWPSATNYGAHLWLRTIHRAAIRGGHYMLVEALKGGDRVR